MHAHTDNTPEIDRIDISEHARQRYIERVGFDAYPAEKIRELMSRAEPDAEDDRVSNAVAWATDEAIVVTDTALEAVTTVLRPGGT
jgi:hypothetical protein